MNNNKINELMDILEREIGIYEELLKISQDKTEIIVKGKVTELDNITKLEQTLVLNMGSLEALREKTINDLSHEFQTNPWEITISELFRYVDQNQAQRLEEYKTKLLNTINEIKTINDLNAKLIQNSIDYINFSVNVLSSAPAADNNYGNTGHTNDGKQKTYFDVKL